MLSQKRDHLCRFSDFSSAITQSRSYYFLSHLAVRRFYTLGIANKLFTFIIKINGLILLGLVEGAKRRMSGPLSNLSLSALNKLKWPLGMGMDTCSTPYQRAVLQQRLSLSAISFYQFRATSRKAVAACDAVPHPRTMMRRSG